MEYLRQVKKSDTHVSGNREKQPAFQLKDRRSSAVLQEKRIGRMKTGPDAGILQLAGKLNRFGNASGLGVASAALGYAGRSLAYYLPQRIGGGAVAYQPAGRTIEQLWLDASPQTVLPREDRDPATVAARIDAAKNELVVQHGLRRNRVEAMLTFNEAQTPRNIAPPVLEDGWSGGHTDARHVLSPTPPVRNLDDLVLRVLGAPGMPRCPGAAGAFDNAGAAQAAIGTVMSKDWRSFWRDRLAAGAGAVLRTVPGITFAGRALRRGPGVGAYNVALLPPYIRPNGQGVRPMYPGDDVVGRMAPFRNPAGNYVNGAGRNLGNVLNRVPLTVDSPLQSVTVRAMPLDIPGGFAIHSAWPA